MAVQNNLGGIRSFKRLIWAFEVQKPQRFIQPFVWAFKVRLFRWASEIWKNQVFRSDGLLKYRNPKNSLAFGIRYSKERENFKIRSDRLLYFEERENSKDSIWQTFKEKKTKKSRFDLAGFQKMENQETKIQSDKLPKNEKPRN
ncbi:hypothetical protein RhiirC2_792664 [Rhizophagus irregularis]|uniref:Uncharacterized protein n=1 Tax=Rhizophagus irregularis TaxID=588596 RepID=A0A2N1MGW2_9GLOM|nr:hypothetical protein RhiirC2_792664 [Rhizophagus irregularis]